MRTICLWVSLLILMGCASRLVLTEHQNELLNGMTEASAVEIIEKIFTRTDEQSGLYGSNGSPFFTNPQIISIENGLITYTDYEEHLSGVSTKVVGNSVTATSSWTHSIEKFTFDFRKIKKVRIVNRNVLDPKFIKSTDGTQFGLFGESSTFVNIDVKKEYTDAVIAVAKFYNPEVVITSGIGL